MTHRTLTLPTLVDHGPARDALGLVHRARVPAAAGSRPAIVLLHGMGGDEDAMAVFAATVPADWLIVSPRAPHPGPAGGFAWHPRRPGEWPPLAAFDDAADAVAAAVGALPAAYAADPARVHLMGFSQGAATAYAAALRHRGRVRAIAGLVGFVPPGAERAAAAARPLAGLPIHMAVGRRDPYIPLERSRSDADVLRAAGAVLSYHEYDVGHKLAAAGMRDLAAWWRAAAGDD